MTTTTIPASTSVESAVGPDPSGAGPLRSLLTIAVVVVVALASWNITNMVMAADSAPVGIGPLESIDQSAFAAETGVWIEHVTMVGGGGLIEIRYRVLDVDKSEIVHDFENPPRLIAEDGFELRFQRHEHSHSRANRLGATYSEQLVNVGGYLSPGDIVTVMIGAVELEGVEVL